jgi:stress response protein YsnF
MALKADHSQRVVPVVEERAALVKRKRITGGIRVSTVVHEAEEMVDEPFVTETVELERIPLDCWVEAAVPVRQEGDTTIITLVEEVVVVERRLKAIEEVRLTRRRITGQAQERIVLRSEKAVVERLDDIALDGNDPP